MELTPKQAIEDYYWLRDRGHWEHFSFYNTCRRHWQPSTEQHFLETMRCKMRFNQGSKMRDLAAELRRTREDLESGYCHEGGNKHTFDESGTCFECGAPDLKIIEK